MNKFLLLLGLSCLSTAAKAQPVNEDSLFIDDTAATVNQTPRIRKYPARLWEISGNGLKQPSYLYGTMHVSKKLAFNLGDTFYRALQAVDVVALELTIDSWLGNIGRNQDVRSYSANRGYGGYGYGNQYGNYYKQKLDFNGSGLGDILSEVRNYDYLSNYLLYRQGYQSPNYSEKTYVDMYIHQVGKKLGKYCTGLEDFELSRRMVDRSEWRERVLTNKRSYGAYSRWSWGEDPTETAYREGDLDLIDSMDRMYNNNTFYRKWMLYERNKIMADQIEQITKTKRLFAAVGCAHLPGDSGVIEFLRRKGFTVKPVYDAVGDYAFKQKLKLDATIYPVQLKKFSSHSGELEFDLPGTPVFRGYGNNEEIFYADVNNGAYYLIKRMPWFGSMKGITREKMLKRIDSALYENVMGDITSKSHRNIGGNPALEISNRTKSGETQRHMFLVLANDIWYVKLSSTGEYAGGKEAKEFFKSFAYKGQKTKWNYAEPQSGGYRFYWPAPVVVKPYSFDTSTNYRGHQDLEFTDEKNNYFFLKSIQAPDPGYDKDTFHMHQIALNYAFYHQGKMDSAVYKKINGHDAMTFVVRLPKTDKYVHLLLAADMETYYCIGVYTDEKRPPQDFLNKFSFIPFRYKYQPVTKTDSLCSVTYARPDWARAERAFRLLKEEENIKTRELRYPVKRYDYQDFDLDEDSLFWDQRSTLPVVLPSGEVVQFYKQKFSSVGEQNDFTEWRKLGVLDGKRINMKRYHFVMDSMKHAQREKRDKRRIKQYRYKMSIESVNPLDTLYWQNDWLVYEKIEGYKNSRVWNYYKYFNSGWGGVSISTSYDATRGMSEMVKNIVASVQPSDVHFRNMDSLEFGKYFVRLLSSTDSIDLFRAMDMRYHIDLVPARFDDTLMSLMKKFAKNTDWGEDYAELIHDKLQEDNYLPLVHHYMDEFRRVGDTSETQAKMLWMLAKLKNRIALDTMLYWLLEETPLAPENNYGNGDYSRIIYAAYDSLKLWVNGYRKLLPLTRYKEYEDAIMSLGVTLLDSGMIDSSVFRGMANELALGFRDDLKRKMSKSASGYGYYGNYSGGRDEFNPDMYEYGTSGNLLFRNYGDDTYSYYYEDESDAYGGQGYLDAGHSMYSRPSLSRPYSSYRRSGEKSENTLYDKAKILTKFYKQDADVAKRLNRVFNLKNKEEKMLYLDLFLRNGIALPDTMYNHYLSRKDAEFGFVQMLKKYHLDSKIPAGFYEEKNYATSFVYYRHFDEKEDTVVYVGKKQSTIEGETGNLYFWKSRLKDKAGERNESTWRYSMVWIGARDTLKKMPYPVYFKLDESINKKMGMKEIMAMEEAVLQYWRHYYWDPMMPEEESNYPRYSDWSDY